MGIVSINVNTTGLVGNSVTPRRCTMVTTDNLAVITAPGYLNNQNLLGNTILPNDIFDVIFGYNINTNRGSYGSFQVIYNQLTGFTLEIASNDIYFADGEGIYDTSGHGLLLFGVTPDAVNYATISNASTGNRVQLGVAGTDTNIGLQIFSKGNKGVDLRGRRDGSKPSNGYYGEFSQITVASAEQISLTTATPLNVCYLDLDAGDWYIDGNVTFSGNAATLFSYLGGWISTTSATTPDSSEMALQSWGNPGIELVFNPGMCTPQKNLTFSETTRVYLSAVGGFTVNTATVYGSLRALRIS